MERWALASAAGIAAEHVVLCGEAVGEAGNPILLFTHLLKTYGNIACYQFLGTPIVFINDPEYVREILVKQGPSFAKERTVRRMRVLLGQGADYVG